MDGIAVGATLTVVVVLGVELYGAARAYRDGRLQLRRTDFLSRVWTAVCRGSTSLWRQLREVSVKMHIVKESEDLPAKPTLKEFAQKVKASFAVGKGRLPRSTSKQELTSSRSRESHSGSGSSVGKRTSPKKPPSRTMSVMLVR